MQNNSPIFSLKNVSKNFGSGKKLVEAVKNVTFDIAEGEIISIVGGSSCGKSVLAKTLLGLFQPTLGTLTYRGEPITNQKDHWSEVQCVFQDPFSCFNQFFTIRSQLKAAFGISKEKLTAEQIEARVDQGLKAINMTADDIEGKYPFELSGGQMQRMLLARIFALQPKVLIADEPTSMVDACVRAGILEYLMKLKVELNMTIVFVTHDVGLAYFVSDRLFIMHGGEIVESGSPDDVTQRPQSPHTIQLLEDIPEIHRDWIKRPGR
jgi:peptide/nickel transport system ATP-binding protein